MLVGYARTSTLDQDAGIEDQKRDLLAAGCQKLFFEQVSALGRRPQLDALIDFVREDDAVAVTRLDRLARSVGDLLSIVARLEAKHVSLRVLSMSGSEPLDTSSAVGKLTLSVLGAISQFEREIMLERQREGIAKAKVAGKYRGRAPTVRKQAGEIMRLKESGLRPSEIAAKLGIGRASVYRILGANAGDEQQRKAA